MKQPLVILLLILLTGCSRPKEQLNVYIWPGYLDSQLVTEFERQFDCRVTLDFFDDNESMIAKLAAGGASIYDVVTPSTYVIPALVQRGLLAPLRRENLPNYRHLDPEYTGTEFDPGNTHTIPLGWGTAGILIRPKSEKAVEPTWKLFFDPASQPGPFVILEDPRAWIDAAMHFKGHQPNGTNAVELGEARDLLVEAKGRSLGFASQSASISKLLSREVALTMGFSMDAARITKEDPEVRYVLPREGSGKWMDNWAIPSGAPHRDLAERFLNFMLDPRIAARFANQTLIGTPNRAAREFINPSDLTNSIIYPGHEVMQSLWYAKDLGQASKLYDEIWTQVRSK